MTYNWRQDAACKGMAADLFFPQKGYPIHHAKAVCRECPVTEECLDFALIGSGEKFGIWGGTTEQERRRTRRRRSLLRLGRAS